ncbi:hypothetical protein MAP00_006421 [Monascus purpureus]|nr:hypothetical protein MAP00_006421 [Monascus purpureus]
MHLRSSSSPLPPNTAQCRTPHHPLGDEYHQSLGVCQGMCDFDSDCISARGEEVDLYQHPWETLVVTEIMPCKRRLRDQGILREIIPDPKSRARRSLFWTRGQRFNGEVVVDDSPLDAWVRVGSIPDYRSIESLCMSPSRCPL